ncbi:MAG: HAMP domain-containing protein, partial [Ilumatobacteraceae bacterium]
MGLRWKVALALAAVALIATTAVGIIGYRSTSARLIDEVDRSLNEAVSLVATRPGTNRVPTRSLLSVYAVRVLDRRGEISNSSFDADVPVQPESEEIVGRQGASVQYTVSIDGERYRVHAIGLQNGAFEIARSLGETDRILDDVRRRTILLVILVSVAAAAVGWLIAGTVVAPLRRLTGAAEEVESSGRLDVDVPGTGSDEVGRLGAAFRSMLGALERSRADQQRLVQDAGHELRTPLTSLRTNLAVLQRHPEMAAEMQTRILDDLDGEVNELTDLVNELVTAASGHLADQPAERLDLGEIAERVAERVARRRSREVDVECRDPAVVSAPTSGLERAITNLIENACKFDRTGGPIDVVVERGSLTV